jgi:lauroyl/myristoyl acyltransferase
VSAAPAFFAAKGKAPIVVAWSRPLKDGHYRCEVVDVIPAADARDIWGTTQRCLKDLEKIIRRHPSCWVLNYNCFRKQPTEKELAELQKRETTASMP